MFERFTNWLAQDYAIPDVFHIEPIGVLILGVIVVVCISFEVISRVRGYGELFF